MYGRSWDSSLALRSFGVPSTPMGSGTFGSIEVHLFLKIQNLPIQRNLVSSISSTGNGLDLTCNPPLMGCSFHMLKKKKTFISYLKNKNIEYFCFNFEVNCSLSILLLSFTTLQSKNYSHLTLSQISWSRSDRNSWLDSRVLSHKQRYPEDGRRQHISKE